MFLYPERVQGLHLSPWLILRSVLCYGDMHQGSRIPRRSPYRARHCYLIFQPISIMYKEARRASALHDWK